jgi:putative lipoic acid-binding regulatory protein
MSDQQETPFEFPCAFPIKAMGRAASGFDLLVVEIVRRHAPGLEEGAVRVRESSGGKWVSVTVTVQAESKDQLDAIYRDLTADARVVWAL